MKFIPNDLFLFMLLFAVCVNGSPVGGDERALRDSGLDRQKRSDGWDYENPDWALLYKKCGGRFQSPVNIDPSKVKRKQYEALDFKYDREHTFTMKNNGHSVQLDLPSIVAINRLPYIGGAGLNARFTFVQLHFHWGGDSSRGSEHHIGSKQYAGELHLVHFNTRHSNFEEATKKMNGLAVLGILLEIQPNDNPALNPIVNQLAEVENSGSKTTLRNTLRLDSLLPSNTVNFYRYFGSLTTPGCDEIVTWTLLDTPIGISERQIQQMRGLKNSHGHKLMDGNSRPVQSINYDNRKVFYNTNNIGN